jgi:hypothetical protein
MFTFQAGNPCFKTTGVDEDGTGTLDALPGCNPVFQTSGGKTNCQNNNVGFLQPTKVYQTGADLVPDCPVSGNTAGCHITIPPDACQPGQQQQGCSVVMPSGQAPPDEESTSNRKGVLTSAMVTTDSNGHSTTLTTVVATESTAAKGTWKHVNSFKQCRVNTSDSVMRRLVKRAFYRAAQ